MVLMNKWLLNTQYFSISRKILKPFIICCVLFTLLLSIGCVSDNYPGYFIEDSSYRLSISTNEPITNVTFYIPLPVKNGRPMVGERLLKESDFVSENFTASFTQSPPGLNLSGSYPVSGNKPWFVKLNAPQMFPDPGTGLGYEISINDHMDVSSPLLFFNTLSPIGNESIILPKFDFTPSTPATRRSRRQDRVEYDAVLMPEKTLVFANYYASSSVEIHFGSDIEGDNYWKEQNDASIGNSYVDGFLWSNKGESHGWATCTGRLIAAEMGFYPNLTHPVWQKAIQRAQQET
jgi:hypothetical protein